MANSATLKNLTIVDTPGVLSGEKQKSGRSYSYSEVLDWFADRSDMIIVMLDVQKPDLSDEMGETIRNLQKHYDKIRVVLNKADSISHQNLLKIYGAILWSLGRVITSPEVTKIYIGSFWDRPLAVSFHQGEYLFFSLLHLSSSHKSFLSKNNATNYLQNAETRSLMEIEMEDLMKDLNTLPRMGAVRKVNDMVKRIRQLRVHAILLDHIRMKMPSIFGKDKKRKELLNDLGSVFRQVMNENNLSYGDFPDINKFKSGVESMDLNKFPKLKGDRMKKGQRMVELNRALKATIPALLNKLPGINSSVRSSLDSVDSKCCYA